jgi:channel protein (hemolysin III family)
MLFICLIFYVKDSPALARPRNLASRIAHQLPVPLPSFSGNSSRVCIRSVNVSVSARTNGTGLEDNELEGNETCVGGEEQAFLKAAGHFEAAQQMLQLVEFKLPGLERWRNMMRELSTQSVAEMVRENTNSVAEEGRRMQENIAEAMHRLDASVEAIREELKVLGSASMEGCIVCWAKLARRLASSRENLQDQLARVQVWSVSGEAGGETQQRSLLGLTPAEWREYTAAEIKSLSLALHTGIAAATRAVRHATGEVARVGGDLTSEVQQELRAEMQILWDMTQAQDAALPLERWPILVFLLSGVVCLTTSAIYHLFNCHSLHVANMLLLVDYAGIGVLIAGSFVPPVYYGFYCDDTLRSAYLVTIVAMSTTSSAVGIYSGLNPSVFWRFMRVICYSANAMFAVVPCGHLAWRFASGQPVWGPVLPYIGAMLGLYALGTIIYFYKFPEKYWPGSFDFIFSSHQLWHVIVFLAAFLHFFCSIGHFQWRALNSCSMDLQGSSR